MDATLRLQVIFGAIDKLTAPVRRLQAGAKGLSKDIASTQRTLAGLKKQEADLAGYKGLEARLRKTGAALDGARAGTAKVREEIEATEQPTKQMLALLARWEKAEKKAEEAHERNGAAVQASAGKLRMAGIEVERLAEHEDRLADRLRETSRQLDRQKSAAERMERFKSRGEAIRSAGGKVAAGGAIATAGVTLPIVAFLKSSIDAARESKQAMAQVEAGIASMGNASGFTAKELGDMAGKLQDISLFDDDDIMRQVTANLITFGKISGPIFDRAQHAIIDMSARLGQDLKSSAIQVGKALDSPVQGMMALSKIGAVNREWAKANKVRMQGLIDAGHRDKAQIELLQALEHQFKDSALAARKAAPDAAMQQSWRTFQETVGALAEARLPALIDNVNKLLDRFNNMNPATQELLFNALLLAAAFGPLLTGVGALMTILGSLVSVIGSVAAVFGISAVAVGGIFLGAVVAAAAAALFIYRHWAPIRVFFSTLWNGIQERFAGAVAWLRGLAPMFSTIGRLMLEGLLTALSPMRLVQHILKLGSAAVTALKGVLGIHSPSRVFAGIGGHMMGGLALGLDQGAAAPLGRLHRLGRDMSVATAAGALMASPVTGAGLPRGASPGDQAAASRGIAAGVVHHHHNTFHVTIQGGGDVRAQAREFMAEVKRIQSSDRNASYEDRD